MTKPWTFRRIDERAERKDGFGYVSDAEGRDILHVGERTLSEAENVAVGVMAAAAPDMLAALQDILNCVSGVHGFEQLERCAKKVSAAIAKAEGRTP